MLRKLMKKCTFILIVIVLAVSLLSCSKTEEKASQQNKLKVVTTIFPLWEFAKNVGRDRVEVAILLPPGVEAHAFEPKPTDILTIQKADVFIYTGSFMEPWVADLLKGIDKGKLAIVDTSIGINILKTLRKKLVSQDESLDHKQHHGHSHDEHAGGIDPHIWLDFSNAIKMVNTIAQAMIEKDPKNKEFYQANARDYTNKIEDLDRKYRHSLASCRTRVILHAGHFSFGYFAQRYGLKYVSAYKGFTPDSEPTPKMLVNLIRDVKKYGVKTIYYEELIMPRVAHAISKETGCDIKILHGAHNISKEEKEQGVTFVSLMEKNLENLMIGLQCQ